MTKYLKIFPDPDAHVCHCGDGNPDCEHFDFCPECGGEYKAHEGHDCIDGVPVQDLRALAKELRDDLAACETERDRLRTQARELTDAELDAIYPEGRSLGTYHHEIHRLLLRRVIAAGIKKSLIAGSARLVPTPHQAEAVVALTDDMIRREWCNLHSGVEGDPDESAYSAFEEGVRQGFSLRAQPTNNETRG